MRLDWAHKQRFRDEGLDHGVLYSGGVGVAWNGLIAVDEQESGELDATNYFEGRLLVIEESLSDFKATIEAYTYPTEFKEYDGFGPYDPYKRFGLSYRSDNKIHLVYNTLAKISNRTWTTIGSSTTPSTFLWDISASAIPVPGASPASHLVVDTLVFPDVTAQIEEWLYGTDTTDPRLPSPGELIDLFETETMLKIVQHGDGTWTATGPDDMLQVDADGFFHIQAPTAFPLPDGLFVVSSI